MNVEEVKAYLKYKDAVARRIKRIEEISSSELRIIKEREERAVIEKKLERFSISKVHYKTWVFSEKNSENIDWIDAHLQELADKDVVFVLQDTNDKVLINPRTYIMFGKKTLKASLSGKKN